MYRLRTFYLFRSKPIFTIHDSKICIYACKFIDASWAPEKGSVGACALADAWWTTSVVFLLFTRKSSKSFRSISKNRKIAFTETNKLRCKKFKKERLVNFWCRFYLLY